MELKDFFTLFFSLGALVFSLLTFMRGRRFDNANHLYKVKLETYNKILVELNRILSKFQDQIFETQQILKNPTDENLAKLESLADEADDFAFRFNDFFVENSLVIPMNVLNTLSKFRDKLMDSGLVDTYTSDLDSYILEIGKVHDDLLNDADKINELLRQDLHIEVLNTSLYKRLQK